MAGQREALIRVLGTADMAIVADALKIARDHLNQKAEMYAGNEVIVPKLRRKADLFDSMLEVFE